MTDLAKFSDETLRQRHTACMIEIHAARSAGQNAEAYDLAQALRRMNSEMSLRLMAKRMAA